MDMEQTSLDKPSLRRLSLKHPLISRLKGILVTKVKELAN